MAEAVAERRSEFVISPEENQRLTLNVLFSNLDVIEKDLAGGKGCTISLEEAGEEQSIGIFPKGSKEVESQVKNRFDNLVETRQALDDWSQHSSAEARQQAKILKRIEEKQLQLSGANLQNRKRLEREIKALENQVADPVKDFEHAVRDFQDYVDIIPAFPLKTAQQKSWTSKDLPSDEEIQGIREKEKDKKTRKSRLAKALGTAAVVISVLTGCAGDSDAAEVVEQPTMEVTMPFTPTPSERPTDTFEPTATAEQAVEPTATVEAAGGGQYPEWFNPESDEIKVKQAEIIDLVLENSDWFTTPPDSSSLAWKYFFNNRTKDVKIVLEAKPDSGYPTGSIFTFTSEGDPIRIDPGEEDYPDFSWELNTFVKKSVENDEVTAILDKETWKFVPIDSSESESFLSEFKVIENEGLEYSELGSSIAVYDLSEIRSVRELDVFLRQRFYPEVIELESSENTRKIEIFVSKSAYEGFSQDGLSFKGWIVRHAKYLNKLLKENKLDLTVDVARVIIVNNEASKDFNWHFWQGEGEYVLPSDVYVRWVVNGDYRDESAYYNEEYDLDFGLAHELGHYVLNLWDLYFLDFFPAEEERVKVIGSQGEEITLDPLKQAYPGKWLMVGSKEQPILSPFSSAAIEYFQEIGINSWEKAYNYWTKEAFNDLAEKVYVKLTDNQGNPIKGTGFLFIAQINGVDEYGWTLQRSYNEEADWVSEIKNGKVSLPDSVKGFGFSAPSNAFDPLAFEGDVRAFGKNFLLVVVTDGGEIKQFSFTSYELWFASRQSENEEVAYLNFKME